MSFKLKKISLTLLLAVGAYPVLFAQGPPPPPPPPGLVVPIDENIVVLIIAGCLYGLYAVRVMKKKSKQVA